MVNSINSTTSRIEPGYDLMPSQESISSQFGGDAAAELAAMVFLFSRERSKDASENRDALESGIQARQAEQVQHMHQAADARFASAVIQGTSQMVGGIVSMSGGDGGTQTGQVITGSGNILAGGATRSADAADAAAQAQADQAGAGIRALEEVEQNATDAQDMKKRTLDFIGTIQETKAEADKALVSIRV